MKKKLYWNWIYGEAAKIKSDGCTVVSELFHAACLQHDLAYYWAKNPVSAYRLYLLEYTNPWDNATAITRSQADEQFKKCIKSKSKLKNWSPLAYLRWFGVRIGGRWAWNKHRQRENAKL